MTARRATDEPSGLAPLFGRHQSVIIKKGSMQTSYRGGPFIRNVGWHVYKRAAKDFHAKQREVADLDSWLVGDAAGQHDGTEHLQPGCCPLRVQLVQVGVENALLAFWGPLGGRAAAPVSTAQMGKMFYGARRSDFDREVKNGNGSR